MLQKGIPTEFTGCGVRLVRLTEPYIEMVRCWRMKPEISSKMEFRGTITPEMQKKWFHSIDNEYNYYFLMYCKNAPVGLVNLKDVDFSARQAEGGIFIGEPEKTDILFGVRGAIAMYHFGFTVLQLETIIIHVLKDNPGAIRMNEMMGFVIQPDQDQVYNQEYRVDKDRFECMTAKIQQRFLAPV